MQRRFLTLAAAAVLLPLVAACDEESPLLTGGEFFPGGPPVTLQATFPASEFFDLLGTFAGYPASIASPSFLVVAEDFGGVLDSHALLKLRFPATVQHGGGVDTLYTLTGGRLLAPIDSSATTVTTRGNLVFQLWEVDQEWDASTATWELAVDTGGAAVPWQEPGGTRGELLATSSWNPTFAGDTLSFALDSLLVRRIAADDFRGLLVTVESGERAQLGRFTLRAGARPASADTVVQLNVTDGRQVYVFNPAQPRAAGALEVGGIASARTLFRLDLDRTVPGCANPQANPSCPRVPLGEVVLNGVDLLLRPQPVPQGFQALDSTVLVVRRVSEVELGRAAPLGERVPGAVSFFAPGDSVVRVPLTNLARQGVVTDTLTGDFALVSEPEANSFGALWFESEPRLQITYTLPAPPRLP